MNGWRIVKGLGLVLFLLLGILSFPNTGWTLSCAEPVAAEQAYEDADAVFKGIVRILSIKVSWTRGPS